jgi:hypothetical protein
MIIAFTGHRNARVEPESIAQVLKKYPGATVVHGGAEGFDTAVDFVAREMGIVPVVILPDYSLGNAAPLIRDREIVRRADLLIAWYDGRRKGGTFYTVNQAKKKGVPIINLHQ